MRNANLIYLDVFDSKSAMIDYLVKKQNNLCYLCFEKFTKNNKPTVDHIMPLARGGTWHPNNLALAHRRCNQEKGDRIFLEDGTLEPKKRKYIKNRRKTKRIRNSICLDCYNGRLLARNEFCRTCSSPPGPPHKPWHLKVRPAECDHSELWCWACACGLMV